MLCKRHLYLPKYWDGVKYCNISATLKQCPFYSADYSVGDYISIELTDANSLTAKAVHDVWFGGPRGKRPNGEPPKKQ